MKPLNFLTLFIGVLSFFNGFAQQDISGLPHKIAIDSSKQRDLADVIGDLLKLNTSAEKKNLPKKAAFSVIPSISYSLTTGFDAALNANVGFYTLASHRQNLSQIAGILSYDTKNQKIFSTISEIWIDENNYKLVSDIRFEQFPENTYGLGTLTSDQKENHLDYTYLRTYLTIYKQLLPDYYAGIGYNYDDHFNISEAGNSDHTVSDFQKYGYSRKSVSSGINLDFLYDSRRNPINPQGGGYANIVFRQNSKIFGSDGKWESLQFDLRKYFKFSPASNNIFAVWMLLWFSQGNTPYLDLPGTGLDMFNNSGRGYISGRFIGKNMLYTEGEYRFRVTANGLLGGVVFANAESLSEPVTNSFKKIAPATGAGLRIKVNKQSNTNICIDYAFGIYKSNGLFLSLGEAF